MKFICHSHKVLCLDYSDLTLIMTVFCVSAASADEFRQEINVWVRTHPTLEIPGICQLKCLGLNMTWNLDPQIL